MLNLHRDKNSQGENRGEMIQISVITGRTAISQYVCMIVTYSKCEDQPGKVANPARGQLNREN